MIKKISNIEESSSNIFVFDLFGNSAYRFEQFDGTQSLPFKVGNRYHLAGNVVTCMPTTLKKLVEGVIPLFESKKSSVGLIIPPLPRYIFAGCCEQKDYCKNVSEQNHPRRMLSDIISLRNSLKNIVTNCGIANVRVLDACCVTGCKNTANIEQRLIGLKSVMAADNVHYLSEGYANLVENCTAAILAQDMAEMATTANNKASQYFWRGFRSPVGAKAPVMPGIARGTGFMRGCQGRQFHPYRRKQNCTRVFVTCCQLLTICGYVVYIPISCRLLLRITHFCFTLYRIGCRVTYQHMSMSLLSFYLAHVSDVSSLSLCPLSSVFSFITIVKYTVEYNSIRYYV